MFPLEEVGVKPWAPKPAARLPLDSFEDFISVIRLYIFDVLDCPGKARYERIHHLGLMNDGDFQSSAKLGNGGVNAGALRSNDQSKDIVLRVVQADVVG